VQNGGTDEEVNHIGQNFEQVYFPLIPELHVAGHQEYPFGITPLHVRNFKPLRVTWPSILEDDATLRSKSIEGMLLKYKG